MRWGSGLDGERQEDAACASLYRLLDRLGNWPSFIPTFALSLSGHVIMLPALWFLVNLGGEQVSQMPSCVLQKDIGGKGSRNHTGLQLLLPGEQGSVVLSISRRRPTPS